ncbi:hypothetical protein TVAG_037230 [Trichomonas vaginalis G3]|uniref:Uncharacterized protein n=1 Tax=Trichomonas vaginalis (strain ATCC PRA-98 / G3) TaxID=412133 RepID=A2G0T0_TRIV3|nr:armadillo (ARM) repeat-containing protein family [Trichomonas vaginalis G3]EAX89238.1 hypothetical protein TVAG_037230 [Trichomonas vaginalis G3]KAI5507021.1 armadillo (ARM) repeat-containing protein family [Trichomonas vaginalis G3]|eukprot:XP_001302168.1 hypothetical protein [Trichomonas vaginalis G3]
MDQLISELSSLSKQGRLMPAEEILTGKLANFEEIVSKANINEKDVETIENVLISLLNVNNGDLSYHCSIRIAVCLTTIYSTQKSPKLWNLITTTSKNPTVSKLYASYYVIKRIGHSSKSMLAGLIKSILSLVKSDEKFYHPVMFLIRSCYHISPVDLKPYDEKILSIAKSSLLLQHEHIRLAAIKLLRTLIKYNAQLVHKVLPIIDSILGHANNSPFIDDEVSYLIANIAALPLLKQNNTVEVKEFTIGKQQTQASDFTETFHIFTKYIKNFTSVFRHFLDIISPQFLYDNINIIFDFVRKNQLYDLSQILSLFGHDVRSNLFTQIAAERPPTASQLHCLRFLASDKAMAHEAAAVSLQLSSSDQEDARFSCCQYITILSNEYPDIAAMYLETAALFLGFPPDDDPQIAADLRGFSLLAANIIGSSKDPESTCLPVENNIIAFLKRSLTANNVFAPDYQACFRLLAVLPSKYVDLELVGKQLTMATKYVTEHASEMASRPNKDLVRLISAAIAQHPKIPGAIKFADAASNAEQGLTSTSIVGIVTALVGMKEKDSLKILLKLMPRILKETPPESYVKTLLVQPMPPMTELLFYSVSSVQQNGPLYMRITGQSMSIRICEMMPEIMSIFSKEEITQFLTYLIHSSTNYYMSHLLILKLCLSEKIVLLPSNLHSLILDTLNDSFTDIERMRVSSEIVAIFCARFGSFDEISKIISKFRGNGKCLVLAALFRHVQMTDNDIVKAMHDLDEIVKSNHSEQTALFSLISLYDSCCQRLTAMPLTGTQLRILMSKLHSLSSLSPYTLFFLAGAYSKLLPVLTPQNNKYDIEDLRLISQMLSECGLPYSKQIFYHLVRNYLAFYNTLKPNFSISYPDKKGTSISLELAACGALADQIKIQKLEGDYFSFISRSFLLLQKRDDSRPEEFILAVSSDENHTTEWVKIVKTVLSSNALPGFQNATIEPMPQVKAVCLKICQNLLNQINEPGELLDDLVTSATRSIETKIERIVKNGFPVLVKIIEKFDGQKCLDLYEPQIISNVKNSFSVLSDSKQFLLAVLSHCMKKCQRNEEINNFLTEFTNGLTNCDINPSSICIAATFFKLLRLMDKSDIDVNLNRFCKPLGDVYKSMTEIFAKEDWMMISDFRGNYEKSLSEILSSVAWLTKKCEVNTNDFVAFLVKEMKCGEEWLETSSFTALSVLIKYEKEEIEEDLILSALTAVENSPLLEQFTINCSHRKLQSKAWNKMADLVFAKTFSKEAAAFLLNSGTKSDIYDKSDIIATSAILHNCPELFYMMFSKSNTSSFKVFDLILKTQNLNRTQKGDIIRSALSKIDELDREDICEFCWTTFKKGGMTTISTNLINNPKIGTFLFSFNNLKQIEDLVVSDPANSTVYMQFIRLGIEKSLYLSEELLEETVKIAVRAISLLGNDPQKGGDITATAVQLFKDVKAKSEKAAEKGFKSVNDREKQVAVGNTESAISKSATKKKVRTLRTFSSAVRKTQDEEWQSLD